MGVAETARSRMPFKMVRRFCTESRHKSTHDHEILARTPTKIGIGFVRDSVTKPIPIISRAIVSSGLPMRFP